MQWHDSCDAQQCPPRQLRIIHAILLSPSRFWKSFETLSLCDLGDISKYFSLWTSSWKTYWEAEFYEVGSIKCPSLPIGKYHRKIDLPVLPFSDVILELNIPGPSVGGRFTAKLRPGNFHHPEQRLLPCREGMLLGKLRISIHQVLKIKC